MKYEYVYETKRVGDLIVQVVADTDGQASDPRGNDNSTEIYGESRHYTIGDGKPPSEHMYILERGGLALLARYMRRFGDPRDGSKVFAFRKLCMLDHSGVTFWTADIGQSPYHWTDSGGWDSGSVGYVIVTEKNWRLMMGDADPFAPVDGEIDFPLGPVPAKVTHVERVIRGEVKEYSDWAGGNVWGYVITKPCEHADDHATDEAIAECPHAEVVDSCWGYIGDPDDVITDALLEAQGYVEAPA